MGEKRTSPGKSSAATRGRAGQDRKPTEKTKSGAKKTTSVTTATAYSTSSGKKKASSGKHNTKETKKPAPERVIGPSPFWNNVMPYTLVILAFLFAVLYLMVAFSGVGGAGWLGDVFRTASLSLIGWGSYLVPLFFLVMAYRWRKITGKGRVHNALWVQFALLMILTAAIFQLSFDGETGSLSAEIIWNRVWNTTQNDPVLPGGLFGAFLARGMYWALNRALSITILVIVDLILLIFFIGLTPETVISWARDKSREKAEIRAAYREELKEARAKEAEEREKNRAEAQKRAKEKLEEEKMKKAAAEKRLREEAEKEQKEKEQKEKEQKERERIEREQEEERRREEAREEAEPKAAEAEPEEPEDISPFEEYEEPEEPAPLMVREPVPEQNPDGNPAGKVETVEKTDASLAIHAEDYFCPLENGGHTPPLSDRVPAEDDLELDGIGKSTIPKTILPGDEELFGSFGSGEDRENTDALPDLPAEESLPEIQTPVDNAAADAEVVEPLYVFPPTSLMTPKPAEAAEEGIEEEIEENKQKLGAALSSFGVRYQDIDYSRGPTITRYEIQPQPGQRVKAIQNLLDDIAIAMRVSGVRYEPSIPGKSAVGIEVPNVTRETVYLRSLIESDVFAASKSKVTACLGADISGAPVCFDIAKMPHLLVAGATGMGKSVCINSIIVSLLYKSKPEEVRLVLIDPKKVEFTIYRDMPHLFTPVISDPSMAAGTLVSAVNEMEKRFELIERVGARDIGGYKRVTAGDPDMPRMPHLVIIIDELADLMMTASADVEKAICRLAQKARAAGIHLIIGTQRPSVDVITGTIKANIPSRIAFTVSSQIDSRTILDTQGAERLVGKGDMLFAPVGSSKPQRVQGSFVSEEEVTKIVNFLIRNNGTAKYDVDFMNNINAETERCENSKKASAEDAALDDGNEDPKLDEAVRLAIESGKISTSLMQRRLEIGYGRAAKIIDRMEQLGYVSKPNGNKPREILITIEEYEARMMNED